MNSYFFVHTDELNLRRKPNQTETTVKKRKTQKEAKFSRLRWTRARVLRDLPAKELWTWREGPRRVEGAAVSAAAAAAAAALLLVLPKGRPLFAGGAVAPPEDPPDLPCSLFCILLSLSSFSPSEPKMEISIEFGNLGLLGFDPYYLLSGR